MSATYGPDGGLGRLINNSAVTQLNTYDNRLRLQETKAFVSGNFMDLTFAYFANSNVQTVTDNLDTGRTVNYTYDHLNRLTSAQSQATSGADCWGQSIPTTGYDRYGNLLTINATQGGSGCSQPAGWTEPLPPNRRRDCPSIGRRASSFAASSVVSCEEEN